jgi:hypothetical protein
VAWKVTVTLGNTIASGERLHLDIGGHRVQMNDSGMVAWPSADHRLVPTYSAVTIQDSGATLKFHFSKEAGGTVTPERDQQRQLVVD